MGLCGRDRRGACGRSPSAAPYSQAHSSPALAAGHGADPFRSCGGADPGQGSSISWAGRHSPPYPVALPRPEPALGLPCWRLPRAPSPGPWKQACPKFPRKLGGTIFLIKPGLTGSRLCSPSSNSGRGQCRLVQEEGAPCVPCSGPGFGPTARAHLTPSHRKARDSAGLASHSPPPEMQAERSRRSREEGRRSAGKGRLGSVPSVFASAFARPSRTACPSTDAPAHDTVCVSSRDTSVW